jgi:hypothetical protein
MKKIVLLTDPDRIDPLLLNRLKHLFPECDIRVIFKSDVDPLPEDGQTVSASQRT